MVDLVAFTEIDWWFRYLRMSLLIYHAGVAQMGVFTLQEVKPKRTPEQF